MTSGVRKFALTTHITLSVGWIGAVAAYLVLVVAAMRGRDDQALRAAWIAMELIASNLIVPLALASLVTGLVMALGTPWGLFRHYWVAISFVLTLGATLVLLQHMKTINYFAQVATEADPAVGGALRGALRGELLHAGVGLLLLLTIAVLNVYKPQGLTARGRRRTSQAALEHSSDGTRTAPVRVAVTGTPRWVQIVGIHAAGVALVFVILHLASGGLQRH